MNTAYKRALVIAGMVAIAIMAMWVMPAEGSGRPHALNYAVVSQGIELAWQGPSRKDVTGYQILRRDRTSETDLIVYVDNTGSVEPAYLDDTVQQGYSYNYRVRAHFSDGTLSGRSSYVRVSFVDGQDIVHGQTTEAEIEEYMGKDWYAVWLEEGKRYTFLVEGLVSGYTLFQPAISGLYDMDKRVIDDCRTWSGNTGQYSLNAQARLTAPDTGMYYIKVWSAGRVGGTYALTMR